MDDPQHQELLALRTRVAELAAEAEALRASEAELRAMFAAMQDLVLVMDGEGHYLKIAETALDLLYRPSNELIGRRMHDVMPAAAADFFLEHIGRALASDAVVTMDYSLPIQGDEVWFSANISPMGGGKVLLVCRNVTERKRLERVLQDSLRQRELLDAQEAALARISTPLIPISDDVVVMPLIGQIHAARTALAIEQLLEGVAARRARVAILDITGVATVDAEVAAGLVRAARAVTLLGARVILTGIRPDVAGHLVALGVDLSGIVTHGTLQAGIAAVMQNGRLRPNG